MVVIQRRVSEHKLSEEMYAKVANFCNSSYSLLSLHADRHAGDMSFTVSFCVCPQHLCNGYLRRALTQGDEISQDGRPEWVAGHLPFGELWPRG